MRVLATGGLGLIGAHTCVELAREGSRMVIVDNRSNSKSSVIERILVLAPGAVTDFVRAAVRETAALDRLFAAGDIEDMYRDAWRWQSAIRAGFPD